MRARATPDPARQKRGRAARGGGRPGKLTPPGGLLGSIRPGDYVLGGAD